ncbi:hypothetical protein [Paenibacillus gallinarum]|uniref:Uncharacterized protein n=1 Tax=Paenibacillus gallinarum TaxID=2762232 RepID=A0ABR8T6L6_9BACL|nr:hypothetical protein [Paenibacillus gallinarum]MBD7971372.1 hypothetical protein [Paenibacillus gallinarum]
MPDQEEVKPTGEEQVIESPVEPVVKEPIQEVPVTTNTSEQTVSLSDEQFLLLTKQNQDIYDVNVWIVSLLSLLIGGMVIMAFFQGWRSTK